MCLDISSNRLEPRIAQEDITVYKVVAKPEPDIYWDCMGELPDGYFAPFRNYFQYEFDKPLTSILNKKTVGSDYIVVKQGLHSIIDMDDAIKLKIYLDQMGDVRYSHHIVEATIPKGSYYYAGIFSVYVGKNQHANLNSIASDTLILHSP